MGGAVPGENAVGLGLVGGTAQLDPQQDPAVPDLVEQEVVRWWSTAPAAPSTRATAPPPASAAPTTAASAAPPDRTVAPEATNAATTPAMPAARVRPCRTSGSEITPWVAVSGRSAASRLSPAIGSPPISLRCARTLNSERSQPALVRPSTAASRASTDGRVPTISRLGRSLAFMVTSHARLVPAVASLPRSGIASRSRGAAGCPASAGPPVRRPSARRRTGSDPRRSCRVRRTHRSRPARG